jgi:hypothetical protein
MMPKNRTCPVFSAADIPASFIARISAFGSDRLIGSFFSRLGLA